MHGQEQQRAYDHDPRRGLTSRLGVAPGPEGRACQNQHERHVEQQQGQAARASPG